MQDFPRLPQLQMWDFGDSRTLRSRSTAAHLICDLFAIFFEREAHLHTTPASLIVKPWFHQLRVVLVRSRNPLNIGAAARAMSNFGFERLRLVTPWEPSYLGARSAVGASKVLINAELFNSVAEAVADCSLVVGTTAVGERELQHPLNVLEHGAAIIREQLSTAPVAILFGSEKSGLSNQDLSHCHWLMRIPTRDEHISMNLGQAVAVCLYELARSAATDSRTASHTPASAEETERITQLLFDALCGSGYVTPAGEPAVEEKVRRLIHRLDPSKKDAELLLGMMRQILWKTKHSPSNS